MTSVATRRRSSSGRRRPSGEPPPLPKELDWIAIAFFVELGLWGVVWTWVFLSDDAARWITERDLELMRPLVDNRVAWLSDLMVWVNGVALTWTTIIVGWVVLIGGLAAKRVRHVLLFLASLSLTALFVTTIANLIRRPRPLGVEILGQWEGFSQPSRPISLLAVTLFAAGMTLVPKGRLRKWWTVVTAALLVIFGFAQVYTGVDHPSDVLPAVTVGVAVVIFLFRMGAPESVFPVAYRTGKTAHLDVTGQRGKAIRSALRDQLGVAVAGVEPVGLAGSAGSTPLRISCDDGPALFAKLYAQSHLRSDRSYKLGRTLLYGRLEDEQRFTSVRRLVQHEDYMLHLMCKAGVDTMEPVGIVEITPDREYLLVSEFVDGAVEISDADVMVSTIDHGLATVRAMWESGLAHRDIKPANVMVQGDRLRLIDVAFGELRPSPWREAVDLANMMLVLALGSSPELVYERARLQFTEEEIAEAFAASHGVTLPSALRAEVRRDGRQLLERFRTLAPKRSPISIQRWSLRRIGLGLWVVFVTVAVAGVFLSSLADIGLTP